MDHPSYGRQRRLDKVIMDMMQERNATEKNNNKTCESTTSSARVMQDAKLGLCFMYNIIGIHMLCALNIPFLSIPNRSIVCISYVISAA